MVTLESYAGEMANLVRRVPADVLDRIVESVERARRAGRIVFVAGNGGSASTASHLACDLMKTAAPRPGGGVRVVSLTDNLPTLTAVANDIEYAEAFAYPLRTLGGRGDVFVGISVSGNSPNVVRAAETARDLGLEVIGLLGRDGGRLRPLCDIALVVPTPDFGLAETAHLLVVHALTARMKEALAA